MQYVVDFGVYSADRKQVPHGSLQRISDSIADAVEAEGLYCGGGVREYTFADAVASLVWIFLTKLYWRFHK